jgi:PAS domain-containing protein
MLATYFHAVHRPNKRDMRLLDLYVRWAADIIERHRSEDAVSESEERLRLAQLKTGIGLWDWDLRTDKVTWTPELAAMFGLRRSQDVDPASHRGPSSEIGAAFVRKHPGGDTREVRQRGTWRP